MAVYTAHQISDWILSRVDTEKGDSITPLKLQKLLYYCQAWHLAIFDTPLFDEPIKAWTHGPVVHSVWQRFANKEIPRHCAIPLDSTEINVPTLANDTNQLLEEVLGLYGEHSGSYLEELTHREKPWLEAREGLQEHQKGERSISHDTMKTFYKALNNGQQTS